MTILGFTPVHSKPPSSEWGSGGIRSGPGWTDCRERRRNQTLSHVALSQISWSGSFTSHYPACENLLSLIEWRGMTMGSPQGPDGHPLVLLCGAPELGSDLCIFSPCSILARQGGKMGPPRFSSAHSTSPSPRKASTITGQALKRNKRCWMGGRCAAKNPICMNWCCCQGDVLADQMPGLFHSNVLFMFFWYDNNLHHWEKFSSSKSRFFVKSSLVLKRTGKTLLFHKLVGFGELESWLRPD